MTGGRRPDNQKSDQTSHSTALSTFTLFGQLGLTLAIPILLGVVAGNWLDKQLQSQPLALIFLILLGVAAGIAGAYRQITVVLPKKKGNNAGK